MSKQDLLDFFRYLERRGFLREDLQCDPEHQVETYLRDFCNGDKPTETQCVDLGLPSGTLWATCNVGANEPEEYGNYYTHNEAVYLGVTLPTEEQIKELCSSCSSVWTTQNGVNGRLFTGPNGNTIFMPATGYHYEMSLFGVSWYGDYWSSGLVDNYACYLRFSLGSVGFDYGNRRSERTVRAVKNRKENKVQNN